MQWSVTVWSRIETPIEGVPVLIQPGVNVFNVFVDDIEPLLARIRDAGIRIDSIHNLSEFDPVEPALIERGGSEP